MHFALHLSLVFTNVCYRNHKPLNSEHVIAATTETAVRDDHRVLLLSSRQFRDRERNRSSVIVSD